MSDRPGAISGDFVFQTSDQAGGASQHHAQQSFGRYNTEHDANASGAPRNASYTSSYGPSTSHLHYNAQQQHVAPGQFSGFGFSPSTPLGWNLNYSEFANQYEPQGELVQEQKDRIHAANDFNTPLPVTIANPNHQAFQQMQSANRTPAIQAQNSSFSPPPPQPTQQQPVVQAGMKRKIDYEPSPPVSESASKTTQNPSKRPNISRESTGASDTSTQIAAPADTPPPPMTRGAASSAPSETTSRSAVPENTQPDGKKSQSEGIGPQELTHTAKSRRVQESPGGLATLPAGKVFPIQIGSEMFRLSGASISSDAPSYFSHFFGQQLRENGGRADDVRTLYIDRDPETFRDIALHLQGYHINPKNGEHFVKLFADAQFYSLPRLNKQLFKTDIFVEIGGTHFQIPRDLFSAPGDSPNYFSLGFAQFFSTPAEVFPGLDRNALLRPPSISPPSVPNRSGETFRDLIRLLQGYDLEIRNDEHRSQLLRDARYFHLKGLEQKLIPCQISYNLMREQSEILVRLEDIRQSGISFIPDDPSSNSQGGYISYARPYTDDHENNNILILILEISAIESTTLYLPGVAPEADQYEEIDLRATFHNATLTRITSLFSVIASNMDLPATKLLGFMDTPSGVRVHLDVDCALEVDGVSAKVGRNRENHLNRLGIRRAHCSADQDLWLWGGKFEFDSETEFEWTIKRAHWRVCVEPVESDNSEQKMQVVLDAVKLEICTEERTRNVQRGFL